MACSASKNRSYPKYWNIRIMKEYRIPVTPPTSHPFCFLFPPDKNPPPNRPIKDIAVIQYCWENSRTDVNLKIKEKIRLLNAANIKINTSPYKTETAKLFASIFFSSFPCHQASFHDLVQAYSIHWKSRILKYSNREKFRDISNDNLFWFDKEYYWKRSDLMWKNIWSSYFGLFFYIFWFWSFFG